VDVVELHDPTVPLRSAARPAHLAPEGRIAPRDDGSCPRRLTGLAFCPHTRLPAAIYGHYLRTRSHPEVGGKHDVARLAAVV
jgi:hypothetical protein